jgi:hypothetical protein
VNPTFQQLAQLLHNRDTGLLAGLFAMAAAAVPLVWIFARSHAPSEEEMERLRRGLLAATGRITDGVLLDALEDLQAVEPQAFELPAAELAPASFQAGERMDTESQTAEPTSAHPPAPTPEFLVYSYRIAGVTYNCAQDISLLADRVPGLRVDSAMVGQTVQVRYDPHNPGNSILVAEGWTGLWQHHP